MLQNLLFIHQFRLTKWSFLIHNSTRNAPYIHSSHDSILELWRTFPNVAKYLKNSSYFGYMNSPEIINHSSCSTHLSMIFRLIKTHNAAK